MKQFDFYDTFVKRHIGISEADLPGMLSAIGVASVDELIDQTIPLHIRLQPEPPARKPLSEYNFLNHIREISEKNCLVHSYIGLGYYPTITPPVIIRNILENPGWYTQYTPYQAEISQGRLEALMNFQTMVSDLTGLPIANASLLDEGTAAAEAMLMLHAGAKKGANTFFVDQDIFPQTIDILKNRALARGITIVIGDWQTDTLSDETFAVLVQYPSGSGAIFNYADFFKQNTARGICNVVAADIMALALLTPPGEFGADVAVGSTQRFGVPMGFGGPHAAYFAAKDQFKRHLPGRIIGASIDAEGNTAFRMALQTREQHIKRERATSNICTAQVLLAIMAGMYTVYHGPDGIYAVAKRIHRITNLLELGLEAIGISQINDHYFDTLLIRPDDPAQYAMIKKHAEDANINLYYYESEGLIGVSLNETVQPEDILELLKVFGAAANREFDLNELQQLTDQVSGRLPGDLLRESKYLQHPVFNSYHSETEMLRYIKKLERKDLSLTGSMIPLGSCTMKLNAAAEMLGITLPGFANIHPFAPESQTKGYQELISELANELKIITGFPGISFQPNSGAQGEYAGLMVIRQYHLSRGDAHRTIMLIPSSAHGTNPASAVMAGMEVIVVKCDDHGNIDISDLKLRAEQNKEKLAGLMVTYPSTHGVFEEAIKEVCEIIHQNGGQVYMDGANMNAQVGYTSPAAIGADVCHLNLHKTFAIPHGGGGPGVGPILVAEHLVPFLPSHPLVKSVSEHAVPAVAAAPFGSANILVISLAYCKMLGSEGLKKSTAFAILNANYLKSKLEPYFKVLYSGTHNRVAHEVIFDMRDFKKSAEIEVEDLAKRLMDYGFHAPTVSFPVPGTFMVEPTESESLYELNRFIEAMIKIHAEINEIAEGKADKKYNVLKNAPHTQTMIAAEEWNHPYTRVQASFPVPELVKNKFWPACARVNNAHGDRNLICTCNPIEDYM